MKDIIHMKFDTSKLGYAQCAEYFNQVKTICSEEGYICLCSPFNFECITDKDRVINLDNKWYSIEELREIINANK